MGIDPACIKFCTSTIESGTIILYHFVCKDVLWRTALVSALSLYQIKVFELIIP